MVQQIENGFEWLHNRVIRIEHRSKTPAPILDNEMSAITRVTKHIGLDLMMSLVTKKTLKESVATINAVG